MMNNRHRSKVRVIENNKMQKFTDKNINFDDFSARSIFFRNLRTLKPESNGIFAIFGSFALSFYQYSGVMGFGFAEIYHF